MSRPLNVFERQHHDGRCSSAGGPVVIPAALPAPVDERVAELAIRRLRARIGAPA